MSFFSAWLRHVGKQKEDYNTCLEFKRVIYGCSDMCKVLNVNICYHLGNLFSRNLKLWRVCNQKKVTKAYIYENSDST